VSTVAALLGVVLLTVATGYFVAQEFAFVAADRAELRAAADRGDRAAERALGVMGRLSFMLSGAQLGITVTTLIVGFLAAPASTDLLEPLLDGVGISSAAVALIGGFLAATVVQMVLGELLPKNLALARPERLARVLAPSTLAYLAVAGPVIRVFDRAAAGVLRSVGVEPVEELGDGATLEELGEIIGESGRTGDLPGDLSELLARAVAFGDLTVAEVMVPRTKVVGVSADTELADFVELVRKAGHTHYPVHGRNMDDLIGVVSLTDIAGDTAYRTVGAVARPALEVPGSLRLRAAVEQMRAARQEVACVLDEYGGMAGLITFEDIAEELVGEIDDENDPAADSTVAEEGGWVVDAGMRIDELRHRIGVALPEGAPYETVNGLVMALLGRLPEDGDVVEAGPVRIEVLGVRGKTADQVRILPEGPA
jgi:CBS domain containing-hemolysin-like protein